MKTPRLNRRQKLWPSPQTSRRRFLRAALGGALSLYGGAAWAENKKWRIGVIGHTGRGDYGHGLDTLWLSLPETEIAAVADADPQGLARAVERLKGPRGFASYREMLATAKPDIVAVCPRHIDQHADMVIAAARSGAKGIYIEKPFCRTPSEADAIGAACAETGTKLAVAHRNRWLPVLPMVKNAIREGAIGKLLEIRARGKEDHRGGALDLWVLGSHVMNLIHYFGGAPLACSGSFLDGLSPVPSTAVAAGAEGVGPVGGDRVHARFDLSEGVPAYFDSIRGAGVREANFGLQLIGTKGLIDCRVDMHPFAHFVPGNPFQPQPATRPWVPISSAGIGEPEPIADIHQQIAGHLIPARDLMRSIETGKDPACGLDESRITIEMICAIYESHASGGSRVKMPLENREHPWLAGRTF